MYMCPLYARGGAHIYLSALCIFPAVKLSSIYISNSRISLHIFTPNSHLSIYLMRLFTSYPRRRKLRPRAKSTPAIYIPFNKYDPSISSRLFISHNSLTKYFHIPIFAAHRMNFPHSFRTHPAGYTQLIYTQQWVKESIFLTIYLWKRGIFIRNFSTCAPAHFSHLMLSYWKYTPHKCIQCTSQLPRPRSFSDLW